ncbi:hypothetical protein SNE40_021564 [Patella caerulea]|uniref:Uncharacterized protein n=1 Tax=Patella caerulea TaxID=87958 RepID=A0AAN8J4B1_PATCE
MARGKGNKRSVGRKKKYKDKDEIVQENGSVLWKLPWLQVDKGDGASHSLEETSEDVKTFEDCDGSNAQEFYVILDRPYKYEHCEGPDKFVKKRLEEIYKSLKNKCIKQKLSSKVKFELVKHSKFIRYVKLIDSEIPKIQICVTVKNNLSAEVIVHGKVIAHDHPLWKFFPQYFSKFDVIVILLKRLQSYQICAGNPEKYFHPFLTSSSFLETDYMEGGTIRTTSCSLLIHTPKQQCDKCSVFRRTLMKMKNKSKTTDVQITQAQTRNSNAKLSTAEKLEKLMQLKNKTEFLNQKIEILQKWHHDSVCFNTDVGVGPQQCQFDHTVVHVRTNDSHTLAPKRKRSLPDDVIECCIRTKKNTRQRII